MERIPNASKLHLVTKIIIMVTKIERRAREGTGTVYIWPSAQERGRVGSAPVETVANLLATQELAEQIAQPKAACTDR